MKSNGVKPLKLYSVVLGIILPDENKQPSHCDNWAAQNVLAHDAQEAIKKCRLRKNEYIYEVKFIHNAE